MIKLTNDLAQNQPVPLTVVEHQDIIQLFYLIKGQPKSKNVDLYFIKAYSIINNQNTNLGYLYFYLNHLDLNSHFIGVYVEPAFRNHGVGTNLIASWLKLCMDNGIEELATNKKQRKPFLLHILKKFGFEIRDVERYDTSPMTIYICRRLNSDDKYLLFKNSLEGVSFAQRSVFRTDKYIILDHPDEEIPIIDQVLLSVPYSLTDSEKAETKIKKQGLKF